MRHRKVRCRGVHLVRRRMGKVPGLLQEAVLAAVLPALDGPMVDLLLEHRADAAPAEEDSAVETVRSSSTSSCSSLSIATPASSFGRKWRP
jgi:hypothetical protein